MSNESLLREAHGIAKQLAKHTGGAAYVYKYRDGRGFCVRPYERGPLPDTECELIEIVGTVPS